MASASRTASLPLRKRRKSSEDFAHGSLGSIAGSAVGSSVEETSSKNSNKNNNNDNTTKRKPSVDSEVEAVAAAIAAPISGEILDSTSHGSKGSGSANSRPTKRRKGSYDILGNDEELGLGLFEGDATRILASLGSSSTPPLLKGSASVGSSHTQGYAISALDRLDALGEQAGAAAAKIKLERRRNSSIDDNSSTETFTTNNQKILLEAVMNFGPDRDRASRRDRLESWGGMSDLSVTGLDNSANSLVNSGTAAAAALAASALQYTGLLNDVTAAANFGSANNSVSSFLVDDEQTKPSAIPSKISLNRDRSNSILSTATDPSTAMLQLPTSVDLSSEVQAFVKAAMATVGDQLAEIAGAAESALSGDDSVLNAVKKDPDADSDLSSVASPMIGTTSDNASRCSTPRMGKEGRSRSLSISSALNISVDYDAVAAAVDAAQAVTGDIDLDAIGAMSVNGSTKGSASSVTSKGKRNGRRLPLQKNRSNSDAMSTSTPQKKPAAEPLHKIASLDADDRDMEVIRERARAAAGYVPPPSTPACSKVRSSSAKKRSKPDANTPDQQTSNDDVFTTPRTSNTKSATSTPYTPALTPPSSAKSSKGPSSQKWDCMFDCLLSFIEERREEETKDMTDKEKEDWQWDGNVPTTFKTKDGKALGRWVNNQRSAKSKGVLKEDREERLVNAGLKWSVLASNSWNEMLEELRIYVAEQTKDGRKWDGNVPTNYRIKAKTTGGKVLSDEDKNLGRWVNRQRSLYQAGKLRHDRQIALEKVGLKWSMLATTTWESMYDTLAAYVNIKTKDGCEWDGNVPANYRTNDNPPRALGRWVNRQRTAYVKKKLKAEYVEKLTSVGLKWSVHERRPNPTTPSQETPDVTASDKAALADTKSSLIDKKPPPPDTKSPLIDKKPPPPDTKSPLIDKKPSPPDTKSPLIEKKPPPADTKPSQPPTTIQTPTSSNTPKKIIIKSEDASSEAKPQKDIPEGGKVQPQQVLSQSVENSVAECEEKKVGNSVTQCKDRKDENSLEKSVEKKLDASEKQSAEKKVDNPAVQSEEKKVDSSMAKPEAKEGVANGEQSGEKKVDDSVRQLEQKNEEITLGQAELKMGDSTVENPNQKNGDAAGEQSVLKKEDKTVEIPEEKIVDTIVEQSKERKQNTYAVQSEEKKEDNSVEQSEEIKDETPVKKNGLKKEEIPTGEPEKEICEQPTGTAQSVVPDKATSQ